MANYYIPLIGTDQKISEFNDTVYSTPVSVADFVQQNPEFASIENDTPTTYPDLVLTGFDNAPQVKLEASIISGSHPTQRPR